jgi:hydroxymethylbilane synthase
MKQLIDMAARTLKIATRKSPLALWQANFVKDRLEALYPELQVELVPMSTQGDKILDTLSPRSAARGCSSRSWKLPCWRGGPTSPCTP